MASGVTSIREISSLKELNGWLQPNPAKPNRASEPPLAQGEWGIAVFDFDQCLVNAPPTLMDGHFYAFLTESNTQEGKRGEARNGHYAWTSAVRETIPYAACEKVSRINKLIQRLLNEGWTVKILTARDKEHMGVSTANHLQSSGIAHLKVENGDVIFRKFYSEKKNTALVNWAKEQPQWETATSIRVRFVDDCKKYCEDVARVEEDIRRESHETKQVFVQCFHYIRASSNPKLTDEQKERVVVQLNAYHHNQNIPYIEGRFSHEVVEAAMQELGMEKVDGKIDDHALFMKIKEVAASKGFKF